jgi:hypothetical protein
MRKDKGRRLEAKGWVEVWHCKDFLGLSEEESAYISACRFAARESIK